MKQLLTRLRMFPFPVSSQMALAIALCVVVSGVLCGRNAQAISSSDAALKLVLLEGAPVLFPADQSTMVNPDVQLKLSFKDTPRVGTSGKIRIYDAANDQLVDTLDMGATFGRLLFPKGTVPRPCGTRTESLVSRPRSAFTHKI